MRNFLVGAGVVIALVSVVAGFIFLMPHCYREYGTSMESAKTDIYRENKSYVEGTIRDLRNMNRQWATASDEIGRKAIANLALHRAGELDWDRLPSDVREWLRNIEK